MDLLAEVLPFLVALYLVDSALLVRGGQLLFASGWQGRFAARGPGLRWPGLLPTAEAFVSAGLPLESVDRCPEDLLNRIIWHAMKGPRTPYPAWAVRTQKDED